MMDDNLLLTDLTCAEPATAWTDADSDIFKPIAKTDKPAWRIIDYKSTAYDGRMLQAADPKVEPLRIKLNREGWHAVSIGMVERTVGVSAIEVRLTGMKHWQTLYSVDGPLHEEPWIFADLTGRDLELRYPRDLGAIPSKDHYTLPMCARICSIRAVPVNPEHVAVLEERRHSPLIYTNDGHGIFYAAREPGLHIVETSLDRFRDSDWDICCFGNGGADLVNYPSAVGTQLGKDAWDFPRKGDGNFKRILEGTLAMGIDPLKQAIDQAHDQDQTSWMYIRPQAWIADPDLDHSFRSQFFMDHAECRCIEADGTPDSKLSIAFPEVRRQLNTIAQEALDRDADGITLAFVRGYPMVRYEQPVVDRFRERHGHDPRSLPDSDPALQCIWAEFMTGWLRELRGLVDAAGPSPKAQRRQLSVIVGPDTTWNMRFGFDVRAWAHEGLVDYVLLYSKGSEGKEEFVNVKQYAPILKDTATKLIGGLGSYTGHYTPVAQIRRKAHRWYSDGADGLFRWDAHGCLARLGLDDPELQRLWCEHYLPPQDILMTEIAGITLEYFGPRLAL